MKLPGLRYDPRVGREHPRHVRVDLAELGAERGGQRHRRRVRAAPPQRGHVQSGGHALEPGHDHDVSLLQCLEDAAGSDVDDLGPAMGGVGDDPRLRARVRSGGKACGVDGQGQQRHGDALSRREQQVQLPGVRGRRQLLGHGQQPVRGVSHRRDHHDHVVAGLLRAGHPPGNGSDAAGIRDRGSPVLLDDHRHGVVSLARGWAGDAEGAVRTAWDQLCVSSPPDRHQCAEPGRLLESNTHR